MKRPNLQSAICNPQFHRFLAALVLPLILAAWTLADDVPDPDAVNVFHCTFGDDWDVNYDGWPDRWVRRTGVDYPHYARIAIEPDDNAADKRCLAFRLDGAAAAVTSPPIRVMSRFSYQLEAQLKTEHLSHSTAVLTLEFRDASGRVLQTQRSEPIADTGGWQRIELDQVDPLVAAIDHAVIGLQVGRSTKGDLDGRVSLADVRLSRLPRIAVSTNNPSNVYTSLDDVVVQCELSGIPEANPDIHFQLLDAHDNVLQSDTRRLEGRLIDDGAKRSSTVAAGDQQTPDGFEGSSRWRPRIPDYGYYRVVVRMLSSRDAGGAAAPRELASRTIYLAAVPPLPMPRRGEFGWTLPRGDAPLSFPELSRLLPQVGVSWIKLPVWFDVNDRQRTDELIRFVELLGASNIDVVGIIDQPPPDSELASRTKRELPIADLLSSDSSAWAASLEPVMTRLSLRVRWWQLGRDGDASFVGIPALNKRIDEIRTALFRFGQDVRLGICCDWANSGGLTGPIAWHFQQLFSEEPPSEQQFDELLVRPRGNDALRWVTIEPPARDRQSPRNEASLFARCSELVRRMVAAKVHGADAVFIARPFDEQTGLMRANGMPAELLLPWRTTAAMLSGAEYIGRMQLPSGSHNRIFLRADGQVVMVVWSDVPVEETLYLGDEIRQYDLFGRSTKPEQRGKEQTIRVGTTPSFVLGLHEAVTRWRMSVKFDNHAIPSIFAKPHPNSLRFHNFFPQGVGGTVKIVVLHNRSVEEPAEGEQASTEAATFTLERWAIDPPHFRFQMAPENAGHFPFEIELRNALFGRQPVRIDFTVEADQEYRFSVYRDMEVGTEELTLQVVSHLDKDGKLIVQQLMTNTGEQLADFKCFLRAKGHRPQRMQVYRLGKETDRRVYRFSDGAELVGKEMLLEIEELNGLRQLRYRFIATAMAPESAQQSSEESRTEHRPRSKRAAEADLSAAARF